MIDEQKQRANKKYLVAQQGSVEVQSDAVNPACLDFELRPLEQLGALQWPLPTEPWHPPLCLIHPVLGTQLARVSVHLLAVSYNLLKEIASARLEIAGQNLLYAF